MASEQKFVLLKDDYILGGWACWGVKEALTLVMVQRAERGWVGQLNHYVSGNVIARDIEEPSGKPSAEVKDMASSAIECELLEAGVYNRMARVDCGFFNVQNGADRLNLLGKIAGVGDLVRVS